MNKKECINLINELFEKLDDAKRQIFELETELSKKDEGKTTPIIEQVQQTAEEKTEKVEATPQEKAPEAEPEKVEAKPQEKVEEKPKTEKVEAKPQQSRQETAEVELPKLKAEPALAKVGEDVFYASEILSRIVVAATRYLTKAEAQRSADLITATENARKEILNCLASQDDLDQKKIIIYNVYNSALDNFEEIIA